MKYCHPALAEGKRFFRPEEVLGYSSDIANLTE